MNHDVYLCKYLDSSTGRARHSSLFNCRRGCLSLSSAPSSSFLCPIAVCEIHPLFFCIFRVCVLSLARWMSAGEFVVLMVWVGSMISHLWQGVYRSMEKYHDGTGPCPDDPSSKCYLDSEDEPEPAESTAQKRCAPHLACFLA